MIRTALLLTSIGMLSGAALGQDICEDRQSDASILEIADCLGSIDPDIRDGFAYTEITKQLRGGDVEEPTVRALAAKLTTFLIAPDPHGVRTPFALLTLAEIARIERIGAFMTPDERQSMIDLATAYFAGIEDYRGFIDGEGWRHGIAHGADWLMQLVLHPNLTEDQAAQILAAIKTQVAVSPHAYKHGEPARLSRPVLFIAQHGLLDESDWTAWFEEISEPTPLEDWSEAFQSEAGLARRHNLKAFLNAVYVSGDASGSEAFEPMRSALVAALRAVP